MSQDTEDLLRRTLRAKADQVEDSGDRVAPLPVPLPQRRRVPVTLVAAATILLAVLAGVLLASRSDDPDRSPIAESTTTTVPDATATTTTTIPDDVGGDDRPGEPWDGYPYDGASLAVVGVATGDGLNVRSGPGVDFDVAFTLAPLDDGIVATGDNRLLPDGDVWVRIRDDGREGWANSAFLMQFGETSDVTSESASDVLQAGTMEDLVGLLAAARFSGPQEPTVTIVDGPHAGDLYEITADLIGLGDDSVGGERLHLFAVQDPGDGSFGLRTVEATVLCLRGGDGETCI